MFLLAACGLVGLGTASCDREERSFHVAPPAATAPENVPVNNPVRPGAGAPGEAPTSPVVELSQVVSEPIGTQYPNNAQAQSDGQTLYESLNCVGCHAHGGGGIGPPLMDKNWFYGSRPDQIYQSIVEGRPGGMPSFRGRIPDYQVWELVAFVRSMSGLASPNAAPGREDHMSAQIPPNSMPTPKPRVVPEPTTGPAVTEAVTPTGQTVTVGPEAEQTNSPTTGPATNPSESSR